MAPTAPEIQTLFSALAHGDLDGFFSHVTDDVDWTIMGHSPMSSHYDSKAEFQKATLSVLNETVLKEPLKMHVRNVIGGGELDQAVVEMSADSVCRNGLKYDMTYCWVLKFNAVGKIERVRAYIDTDLLTRAMNENK